MSCYIYLITDLPYWILVTLLNLYSQTSLISQGYKTFPFKVLSSLKDLKRKLKSLGEKWVWPENYLDLTSIGSPKDIVDRLLVCEYSPLPTEGVVQTINRRQCIANQAKSVIFTSLMETGLSDAQLNEQAGMESLLASSPPDSIIIEGETVIVPTTAGAADIQAESITDPS